ncbi:MAG: C40 family peptidase [Lysobacteraceae bacterium]|jgi:cell wall-associated NlpC family hydrolase
MTGQQRLLSIPLWLLALLLAGCGGTRQTADPQTLAQANAVAIHAIGLVGTPYRYGGNTPAGGFDCSGLVGYVFREAAGVALPRTTGELARIKAPEVKRERLRSGDLVLFGGRGGADHIGIYVGQGRFVHAPSRGGVVRLDSLDAEHWRQRYHGARRPLR